MTTCLICGMPCAAGVHPSPRRCIEALGQQVTVLQGQVAALSERIDALQQRTLPLVRYGARIGG